MRSLLILGAALIVLGLFTFVLPVLTSSDFATFQQGGVSVSQSTTNTFVPSWAGAIAVAFGLLLLLVGVAGRPRQY